MALTALILLILLTLRLALQTCYNTSTNLQLNTCIANTNMLMKLSFS